MTALTPQYASSRLLGELGGAGKTSESKQAALIKNTEAIRG